MAGSKVPERTPAGDDFLAVAILHWPAEAARRAQLAAAGRPRLLVLDAGVWPPEDGDDLEDWIRVPVRPDDLESRRRRLLQRLIARIPVHIDDDGLVRRGSAWVALSPTELRLFRVLAAEPGHVVSRAELLATLHPDEPEAAHSRSLDTAVQRLRRRVRRLGAVVHTIPRAGFMLEIAPPEEDIT